MVEHQYRAGGRLCARMVSRFREAPRTYPALKSQPAVCGGQVFLGCRIGNQRKSPLVSGISNAPVR
jgi:hypothetical protein